MGDYQETLFGCMDHNPSCLDVLCCGPCQAGRQCSAIEGQKDTTNCVNCVMCIVLPFCVTCQIRSKINDKFQLDEGSIGACLKGLLCTGCSLCQTHRELTRRQMYPGGFCVNQPME